MKRSASNPSNLSAGGVVESLRIVPAGIVSWSLTVWRRRHRASLVASNEQIHPRQPEIPWSSAANHCGSLHDRLVPDPIAVRIQMDTIDRVWREHFRKHQG